MGITVSYEVKETREFDIHEDSLFGLTDDNKVAIAAGYLNLVVPNWRDKINEDDFDVNDATKCVLGQVFGKGENGESGYNRLTDLGFDNTAVLREAFCMLNAAWLRYFESHPKSSW